MTDDAASLLSSMLQGVQAECYEIRRFGWTDNAENSAFFLKLVVIERVRWGHLQGARGAAPNPSCRSSPLVRPRFEHVTKGSQTRSSYFAVAVIYSVQTPTSSSYWRVIQPKASSGLFSSILVVNRENTRCERLSSII